VEGHYN